LTVKSPKVEKMILRNSRSLATLVLLVALGVLPAPASAQEAKPAPTQEAKPAPAQEAKTDKQKDVPAGTPVLWRDPGDIAARDLMLGPGGEEMKPNLTSVTFLEEETGGYSPKFRVRDGAGKIWVAKVGKEAQPETVAARLVWAVGYVGETNYLVPCVQITGAPEPRKQVDRCEGKGFANVRFEARPEHVKRHTEWGWTNNPFAGTKEFKGLIVMMGLINNWDLKDANNKIISMPGGESGQDELHYIISDLGATFGKTGNFITHNRNEPKDFAKSKFVEKVEGGKVAFSYDGKNTGLFKDITVEDAKWIGGLLSKLSDKQIEDAFRAANYSPEDVKLLTQSLRARINEIAGLS
jgi:ribosomal protein L12E/L44/L45/RPP1/RPP2